MVNQENILRMIHPYMELMDILDMVLGILVVVFLHMLEEEDILQKDMVDMDLLDQQEHKVEVEDMLDMEA
jgi:hypothetical protein